MPGRRIRCFWIEPVAKVQLGLRRYRGTGEVCSGRMGYHDAIVYTEIIERPAPGRGEYEPDLEALKPPKEDPRWPKNCVCQEPFRDADQWQLWHERIWRRVDTGEEMTIRSAPAGAMWDAWWMSDCWRGPDGLSICIRLPEDGEWMVDGPASNCNQKERPHHCWVRHGEPPNLTVDKGAPGESCGAGAGSIQSKDFHALLVNGELIEC